MVFMQTLHQQWKLCGWGTSACLSEGLLYKVCGNLNWPGAKILDIVGLIAVVNDIHPTANTIIVHVGANDIRL